MTARTARQLGVLDVDPDTLRTSLGLPDTTEVVSVRHNVATGRLEVLVADTRLNHTPTGLHPPHITREALR